MSTRFTKPETDSVSIPMGYEGTNVPDDFTLPPCTIEDVDRALFNLFNQDLPFFYKQHNETRRIPVIFATGERFAILRRKRPLRDKNGALILPLISMQRSSIVQEALKGVMPGQNQPLVIKRRLSTDDPKYQNLINKLGVKNQRNVASVNNRFKDIPTAASGSNIRGAKPGTIATRRDPVVRDMQAREGKWLYNNVKRNIFEVISIPPVKHFTVSYEVTFWTQYTQQVNDMMMTMMSAYQDNNQRTFRLETDKGYWFVAYVDASITPGNNFDDFTDSERLVRCSFSIEVPAYVINANFPGAPIPFRSYLSAPDIVFGVTTKDFSTIPVADGFSGDTSKYILSDLNTIDADFPAGVVGNGIAIASSDDRSIQRSISLRKKTVDVGTTAGGEKEVTIEVDPFTGKRYEVPTRAKVTTVKGEATFSSPSLNDET